VIAVLDIDGVLADATHRQHLVESRPKDWAAFFAAVGRDRLLERGLARLRELEVDHAIVLLSGRPESTRADTQRWLDEQDIVATQLVLRADRDFRRAAVLKADLISGIGSPGDIAVVVDDDESVVKALALLGYNAELFR
jgi:hypothetical protein